MARIEGIRIENYRALRNVTIGKTIKHQVGEPLPNMLAFIGPNGSGKSTLLDALGFLGDCLASGVEEACERPHRGGFERLRTKGVAEPIKFELYYREKPDERPISYALEVNSTSTGRAYVAAERFRQRRLGEQHGKPYSFVNLKRGKGFAWTGESTGETEGKEKDKIELEDNRKLAITSLGNLSDHPRIVKFREFLEGWALSYFVPDLARGLPMAGAQRHLNSKGDNLANYVQYLAKEHPRRFDVVLNKVTRQIPGVQRIAHKRAEDGRLLLQFNDRGFKDPFYSQDMSDGTLKLFAYMLLLQDPSPAPLIGIEEPENGLHHQLLAPLAREMRRQANASNGPQIFVTTHANFFVDALIPEEVFVLAKGEDGFSAVRRAADNPQVVGMVEEGIPLGSLWYSNDLGGNPWSF